jgi:hypothetical protein
MLKTRFLPGSSAPCGTLLTLMGQYAILLTKLAAK